MSHARSKSARNGHRDFAQLIAYNDQDRAVLILKMTYSGYHQHVPPLIESEQFRSSRGIVRITGVLYDTNGSLAQEFENRYSPTGAYIDGNTKRAGRTSAKLKV